MTVYVDDVRHSYGRMVMCHLWADRLGELLDMVDRIGVDRRWIQQPPKASWVHFDISLGMKRKALAAGAVLTDRFGPVEHVARRDIASGDPERMQRGAERLASVGRSRALRLASSNDLFAQPRAKD